MPVAGGGEGTVDCFLEVLGGDLVQVTVSDPYGELITTQYLRTGCAAMIETASAAGLPLAECLDADQNFILIAGVDRATVHPHNEC